MSDTDKREPGAAPRPALTDPAARELLEGILDNLPVIVSAVDADGVFTMALGAGLKRLDVSPRDVVGQSLQNDPNLVEAFDRIPEGSSGQFVSSGVNHRGEPWYFANHIFRFRTPPGGAVGFAVDITEQKLVEQQLRQSEDRFRILTEALPVGICEHDPSGGLTYANPGLSAITGLSASALSGAGWHRALHEDDQERVVGAWRAFVRRPNETLRIDTRLRRPDGEVRFTSATVAPLWTSEGTVERFVGFIHDVTEERKITEELRLSEQRLLLAQWVGKIGSFQHDFADDRLTWSRELYRFHGLDPTTFTPTMAKGMELIHPDDRPRLDTIRERMKTHGEAGPEDLRFVRPDGTVHVGRLHVRLLRDASGTPIRSLGVIQDVTEQNALEERVRQSEKMQAIGRLAGGIAHDFNNMLTPILGAATCLRAEACKVPEHAEYADTIITAAKRCAELTQQLLAFGRKGVYRRIVVDLHEVLADVVSLLSRTVSKNIRVDTKLRASQPCTVGDPGQIHHALLNVALNACHAMPEGGVVEIETVNRQLSSEHPLSSDFDFEPGSFVGIRVRDSGQGMDARTRERMFEPFFTTRRSEGGSGLGLASVYGTVSSHGGAIQVESEVGRGTMVELMLPQCGSRSDEADPPSTATAPAPDAAPRQETLRVWVVDDEPLVRQIVTRMLDRQGYEVVACSGGREALTRLGVERPDVVLLDMEMPDMGGAETLRRMRECIPDLPVLIVTGHSVDHEARDLLADGTVGILQKPFHVRELLEAIDAATKPGSRRDKRPPTAADEDPL